MSSKMANKKKKFRHWCPLKRSWPFGMSLILSLFWQVLTFYYFWSRRKCIRNWPFSQWFRFFSQCRNFFCTKTSQHSSSLTWLTANTVCFRECIKLRRHLFFMGAPFWSSKEKHKVVQYTIFMLKKYGYDIYGNICSLGGLDLIENGV